MPFHHANSEDETNAIAAQLAGSAKPGDIFLLHGTLGAGKSTFARSFIRTLCGKDTDVPSPTFTLVQTYDAPASTIWHFDLYRLQDPDEIFEIGYEDALSEGILLIEWPERLGPHTPKHARNIRITSTGASARRIEIDE